MLHFLFYFHDIVCVCVCVFFLIIRTELDYSMVDNLQSRCKSNHL